MIFIQNEHKISVNNHYQMRSTTMKRRPTLPWMDEPEQSESKGLVEKNEDRVEPETFEKRPSQEELPEAAPPNNVFT